MFRILHLIRLPKTRATISIAALIAGVLTPTIGHTQSPVPQAKPGFVQGYLVPKTLPNSLALLPPPPTPGSPALALDQAINQQARTLRTTQRWALAAQDADLTFPNAAGTFSCAVNAPITQADTPHLYALLHRTLTDAGLSTYAAKNHYARPRPFMVNGQPSCTPDDETHLRTNGSYPSGHTATGWAWALILSEIAPDREDAILARGRAYGQSRVICNVHWETDVIEGRFMGAATLARLHADPGFIADLAAAKTELAAVRAKNLKPTRDCTAETAALALDNLAAP